MNFHYNLIAALIAAGAVCAMTACSDDPDIPDDDEKIEGDGGDYAGFYVLNEGNMGSNKCTLDFYDYTTATYRKDVYTSANPGEVLALGDVGNDMAIHNGKLFIAVNGSHKVQVLDAYTCRSLGKIDINSPRYLAFEGNDMFVTSYVGGEGDNGSVVRVDCSTLKITGNCSVGLCPEEMVVEDGKLYVANSYLYSSGKFDNTISVIDLASFKKTGSIEAAVNLHHLRLDEEDRMWASSRGNYADKAADLVYLTDTTGEYKLAGSIGTACDNLAIGNSRLYFYGAAYDENYNATYTYDYLELGETSFENANRSFITDGTESSITTPYALAVQPSTGEILITDVKNYVSSGEIRCYSKEGKLQWKHTTGDIPGHIAFLPKE